MNLLYPDGIDQNKMLTKKMTDFYEVLDPPHSGNCSLILKRYPKAKALYYIRGFGLHPHWLRLHNHVKEKKV